MKKILFSFITLVCLVGVIACGNKEETNNNDTIDDDPTITVKKECCIDNGGRWAKTACTFDGYTETGTTSKEYYEKCVDARISTK